VLRSFSVRQFVDTHGSEALWEMRKNLIFKPLNAYGGKGVYRGKSITHKVFDQLVELPTMAQEFVAPGILEAEGADLKWDLRFYVYEDQIQLAVARLYRGQITNFEDQLGGFAAIDWI